MALVRTRIVLEQLLRKILGKKLKGKRFGEKEIKFLSANRLFRHFLNKYPRYKQMEEAFEYVKYGYIMQQYTDKEYLEMKPQQHLK